MCVCARGRGGACFLITLHTINVLFLELQCDDISMKRMVCSPRGGLDVISVV